MPIGSNFITDIVNLSHRLIAQNDSETAFKVFRSCNSIRNTPQPLESQRVKPLQADYFLYTMITTQQVRIVTAVFGSVSNKFFF